MDASRHIDQLFAFFTRYPSPQSLTGVMDEPLSAADEEGVGVGDGEIVHRLGVDDKRELVHDAIQPILFTDVGTRPQLPRRDPAALLGVERMLRRGLDLFAVEGQVHDHRVGVFQDRGDRILPGRAGARIERPDQCTDLQAVNRLLARARPEPEETYGSCTSGPSS